MINSSTICIATSLAILTFVVPRKYFLLPYILAACFVPADQRIIIMDLDFTVLRILVVSGFLRILLRGEQLRFKLSHFDKLVLAWAICGAVIYVIQWADMRALIYKCGVLFDVIGLYWLFRINIHCWEDIELVAKTFAVCSLVLAVLVALEGVTGKNPFVLLGRVTTVVRQGRYRCQAAFPHSIMLGLFWATLVPLFIGLGMTDKKKILYWSAAGASIFIIFATASSTPLLALLLILFLILLFRYRSYGHLITCALCGLTVALHLVMKAPVWHLIARVNVIGGSTGWHRYLLIDRSIRYFGEWALVGTRDTAHWGWGLHDLTNQYVLEGVRGGFITLLLFVVLLIMAVKTVGRYSLRSMPIKQQCLAWCLCVSVLGHCIAFFGVSYFGQINLLLYMVFAIVGLVYEISSRPIVRENSPVLVAVT
ncbi:MAG: hypothetical protein AMJ43_07430 [Coxiella sp. DG_40]|nr:MAG: hypothetical protein AMJ43_07430 [Coxiella sp. DG_40]